VPSGFECHCPSGWSGPTCALGECPHVGLGVPVWHPRGLGTGGTLGVGIEWLSSLRLWMLWPGSNWVLPHTVEPYLLMQTKPHGPHLALTGHAPHSLVTLHTHWSQSTRACLTLPDYALRLFPLPLQTSMSVRPTLVRLAAPVWTRWMASSASAPSSGWGPPVSWVRAPWDCMCMDCAVHVAAAAAGGAAGARHSDR
jgi:hypothetical protein